MKEYKDEWQTRHGEVISSLLKYLNSQTDEYVLKGGTALMTCYGLDRFSEDIDLDSKNREIEAYVTSFCKKEGFSYRTAKDTDTVKRYMVNYGNVGKPLKVEISFRKKEILPEERTHINGIAVYTIDSLCAMKANAYVGRDKIRDLYDLSFICNRYWESLPATIKAVVRNAVEYKGIEQFDYITREQKDELIDQDKLADEFLSMYDKLGLLYDENEKQIIKKTINRYEEPQKEQDREKQEPSGKTRSHGDIGVAHGPALPLYVRAVRELRKCKQVDNPKSMENALQTIKQENIKSYREFGRRIEDYRAEIAELSKKIEPLTKECERLEEMIRPLKTYEEYLPYRAEIEKAGMFQRKKLEQKYKLEIQGLEGAEEELKRMGTDPQAVTLEKQRERLETAQEARQSLCGQRDTAAQKILDMEKSQKMMQQLFLDRGIDYERRSRERYRALDRGPER